MSSLKEKEIKLSAHTKLKTTFLVWPHNKCFEVSKEGYCPFSSISSKVEVFPLALSSQCLSEVEHVMFTVTDGIYL